MSAEELKMMVLATQGVGSRSSAFLDTEERDDDDDDWTEGDSIDYAKQHGINIHVVGDDLSVK
jgi:hypothetical protein